MLIIRFIVKCLSLLVLKAYLSLFKAQIYGIHLYLFHLFNKHFSFFIIIIEQYLLITL